MAYGCGFEDGYAGDGTCLPSLCGGVGYGGAVMVYGGFSSCTVDVEGSVVDIKPRSNVRNLCIVRCK